MEALVLPTRMSPFWAVLGARRGRLAWLTLTREPADAISEMARAFPVRRVRRIARLDAAVASLDAYLRGDLAFFSAGPLDLWWATALERRIYGLLRETRPGETLTYGELARRARSGSLARCVGRAMARNRIMLAIPCHRLVAAGGIGGFSAPLELKRRLLELERKIAARLGPWIRSDGSCRCLSEGARTGKIAQETGNSGS